MAAHDRHRLLARVDGDGDAGLLLREAPLPRLAVALGEVGVVDVGLVDPDAAPEHDAVLVAIDGREEAVTPLPGGLVAYPAHLGAGVERHGEQR